MNKNNPEVELECKVVARSRDALRIDVDGTVVWIPRSMITDYAPDTDDDFAITSVFMLESYATEKGLL